MAALTDTEARFLIVGAYAMAAHGIPRATGDIDIWVEPLPDNARRVWRALVRFGAPLAAAGVTEGDFAAPGKVYQIGVPPRRIDVMTAIDGVEFAESWRTRMAGQFGGATVQFIGREALLRNKLAAGRPKDLADVDALRGHRADDDR